MREARDLIQDQEGSSEPTFRSFRAVTDATYYLIISTRAFRQEWYDGAVKACGISGKQRSKRDQSTHHHNPMCSMMHACISLLFLQSDCYSSRSSHSLYAVAVLVLSRRHLHHYHHHHPFSPQHHPLYLPPMHTLLDP